MKICIAVAVIVHVIVGFFFVYVLLQPLFITGVHIIRTKSIFQMGCGVTLVY